MNCRNFDRDLFGEKLGDFIPFRWETASQAKQPAGPIAAIKYAPTPKVTDEIGIRKIRRIDIERRTREIIKGSFEADLAACFGALKIVAEGPLTGSVISSPLPQLPSF
jgi:hypothetical protein